MDVEALRRRIGQEFDDECHLTASEARKLFDVYEATCRWRDDRARIPGNLLTRDHGATSRLIAAIDAARKSP